MSSALAHSQSTARRKARDLVMIAIALALPQLLMILMSRDDRGTIQWAYMAEILLEF